MMNTFMCDEEYQCIEFSCKSLDEIVLLNNYLIGLLTFSVGILFFGYNKIDERCRKYEHKFIELGFDYEGNKKESDSEESNEDSNEESNEDSNEDSEDSQSSDDVDNVSRDEVDEQISEDSDSEQSSDDEDNSEDEDKSKIEVEKEEKEEKTTRSGWFY